MNKIWKIIDIVSWGSDFFQSKGIESPRLNIELILSEALKLQRLQLYSQYDKPLSETELATIKQMTLRKAKREPLQYIFNKAHFMDFEFYIDKRALAPRPETELLVEKVINDNKGGMPADILEIGSGSGCISIALAKAFPAAKIKAIDISAEAIELAKENSDKYSASNVDYLLLDALKAEALDNLGIFDIIVSNPPYIALSELDNLEPEVKDYEPKAALTDYADGLNFYRSFTKSFKKLLKPEGSFYLEFGYGQKNALETLFTGAGYEVDFSDDYSRIPRIISGRICEKENI